MAEEIIELAQPSLQPIRYLMQCVLARSGHYSAVAFVALIHGLALWLFLTAFQENSPQTSTGVMQVVLITIPPTSQRVRLPVPAPQFQSVTSEDIPAPDIRTDDVSPPTAFGAVLGTAITVPPRPNPGYINQNPPLLAASIKPRPVQLVLTVLIAVDGRIAESKIAKSCGNSVLDELAQEFTKANWRFRPAQQNGMAIAGWMTVLVTFAT